MFKIDSIEWNDGFTSLPQIRRDFPECKWITIDNDGEVAVYREKPRWDSGWWINDDGWRTIATCRIIEGRAKDTRRRL
tara:strand:+ start:426 stop:659 length:234 start_codon:yes stop_codon:yes gene_type:complete